MNFPNITVIGDNTAGALSDMLYKGLPNGWIYTLSNEVYETMEGQLFEVTGIPPDYKIEYPKAETELFKAMILECNHKDRALEKVKALIQ